MRCLSAAQGVRGPSDLQHDLSASLFLLHAEVITADYHRAHVAAWQGKGSGVG